MEYTVNLTDYECKTHMMNTVTSEGLIPHIKHQSGLMSPVVISQKRDKFGKPFPERNPRGFLLYALPGGERYTLDPEGVE